MGSNPTAGTNTALLERLWGSPYIPALGAMGIAKDVRPVWATPYTARNVGDGVATLNRDNRDHLSA